MVTSVATLMVSMVVVLLLIWFVTDSSSSPVEVTITTGSDSNPPIDTTFVVGDVEGSIRLGYTELRWQLLRLGMIVLALMFAVAVVAAWLLNRRMFNRIGNITAVAETMDEHFLDARFEISAKNDEIDHMATAINAALDRLQGGFERQRMFVRSASHELRTPLTVARTALEIPLAEGRVEESLLPDIEQALVAQSRLEELLDALLTLSRGEATTLELVSLDVSLQRIVHEVQHRTNLPEITWHLDCEEVSATISRTSFEIAMSNLIANAAVHNVPAGWCSIGLHNLEDHIEITIENSGPTVDGDLLARISQPFVKHPGSPGVGLGLAIADELVAAMGGEMNITARAEGGLRVVVMLPGA